MISDVLRDGLVKTIGSVVMSHDRVEAMLRPTLERCDLSDEEVDELVDEARANLLAWQRETSGQVVGALKVGASALLSAIGPPSRAQIAELEAKIASLEALRNARPRVRTPAARPRKAG